MPSKSFTYDNTPYTMYSRSNFTDDQAFNALDSYVSSGKQSFDPSNEKSIMVSPGNVSSVSDMASHVRSMYDQYIAAPISQGIQSIQNNPTVQNVTGPGFTAPQGENISSDNKNIQTQFNEPQQGSGIKALGNYLQSTINDPVATGLLLAGGPVGKGAGTIMQKLAPVVLTGTLKALGMPLGVAGGTLALDQMFDPNTSLKDSTEKALITGGVTAGLQYMMTGWNKMLSSQSAKQDMLKDQNSYNDMLQGFNDVWGKYSVKGDIEGNPKGFLKDISNVAYEAGQSKLNNSINEMLNYVKLNAGDEVKKDFAGNIQSLRTNLTKLGSLQEGSGKYNDVFKEFIDNLHQTQDIVYGIKGKGYPITNPSDTVLSYQLSQDPEFIKALVNSKVISSGQAGSIMKNKGLEQLLPDWKEYVTQRDIDRVVGRSNTNTQNIATNRNVQSQQDLNMPLWQENMQNLVTEINNINRSKAVTESILNVSDLRNTQDVKQAALEALQKFDKVDQISQQLVNVASVRGSRLSQEIQGRTLAGVQNYTSKDYRDLSGFQLSTIGPINSSVLEKIKGN